LHYISSIQQLPAVDENAPLVQIDDYSNSKIIIKSFKPSNIHTTVTFVTYRLATSFLQFVANWQINNSQQMTARLLLAMLYVLGWFNANF